MSSRCFTSSVHSARDSFACKGNTVTERASQSDVKDRVTNTQAKWTQTHARKDTGRPQGNYDKKDDDKKHPRKINTSKEKQHNQKDTIKPPQKTVKKQNSKVEMHVLLPKVKYNSLWIRSAPNFNGFLLGPCYILPGKWGQSFLHKPAAKQSQKTHWQKGQKYTSRTTTKGQKASVKKAWTTEDPTNLKRNDLKEMQIEMQSNDKKTRL